MTPLATELPESSALAEGVARPLVSIDTKVLLTVALGLCFAGYCLLPFLLYAFTPMGPAVRLVLRTATRGGASVESAALGRNVLSGPTLINGEAATPFPFAGGLPAGSHAQKPNPNISILLLGYGGSGHDGAYLSDSMLLAVANPEQKTLSLISLPRDMWVQIPVAPQQSIWSKLNTAYAYGVDNTVYPNKAARYRGSNGGGNLSKDVTSAVVGFPIQYYFALDFIGFRKMIDTIGGLDVIVPSSFTSLYPANDNPDIDPSWTTVSFSAGKQHMSGVRALQYSRAREVIDNPGESNDFARARRQRQVIDAFRDRLFALENLPRLPGVLNVAREYVSTDLSMPGLGDLQSLLRDWRGMRTASVALTPLNYLQESTGPQGSYILTPAAGDWSGVHSFVQQLTKNPEIGEEMAGTQVLIQDATGTPELARKWSSLLGSAGYALAPPVTMPVTATTTIEDRTGGTGKSLVGALNQVIEKQGYRAAVSAGTKNNATSQIVLTLGQDLLNQGAR